MWCIGAGLGIPTYDLEDIPIKNMYEKGDECISEKNRSFFESSKLKIEKSMPYRCLWLNNLARCSNFVCVVKQMHDGEEAFLNFDFRDFGETASRKNSQGKAMPGKF